MSGYVACRWPVEDVAADRAAARIERTARKLGWRSLVDAEGWRVFAATRGPFAGYAPVGPRTIVIGRLFDRDATDHGDVADGRLPTGSPNFAVLCDHLTRKCWGGTWRSASTRAIRRGSTSIAIRSACSIAASGARAR